MPATLLLPPRAQLPASAFHFLPCRIAYLGEDAMCWRRVCAMDAIRSAEGRRGGYTSTSLKGMKFITAYFPERSCVIPSPDGSLQPEIQAQHERVQFAAHVRVDEVSVVIIGIGCP